MLKLVDEEGATIVGLDSCTGLKPYVGKIEEGRSWDELSKSSDRLFISGSWTTENQNRRSLGDVLT